MTHRKASRSSENLTAVETQAMAGRSSLVQSEMEVTLGSDLPQQKGKRPVKQKRDPSTQWSKNPSLSCQMSPQNTLSGCSEATSDSGSGDQGGQSPSKKSSMDRTSLAQSSPLDFGSKEPEQVESNASSLLQANLSPQASSSSTFQGAVGPVSLSELSGSRLFPHSIRLSTAASFRYRDEDFYSSLDSDISEAPDTDEGTADNYDSSEDDLLYCNRRMSSASLSQTSRQGSPSFLAMSCSPEEPSWHALSRSGEEEEASTAGASRTLNMLNSSLGHSLLERRRSRSSFPRNQRRNYAFQRNHMDMENNEYIEYRNLSLSPRSLALTSSEDGVFAVDNLNNNQPSESELRDSGSRERTSQQDYFSYTAAIRLTGQRSGHLSPRSVTESPNNAPRNSNPTSSPLQSSYLPLDMNGISRFGIPLRPLSPIRNRNTFRVTEEQDPSLGENSILEHGTGLSGNGRGSPANIFPGASLEENEDLASLQPSSIARLEMPSTLRDRLPLALLAMSELRSQASILEGLAALSRESIKDESKPAADPEKLKRIQESLLEEDSEEEGDLCRICHTGGGTVTNPLLEPCKCVGSLQYVHQECLKRWLQAKITSGAELAVVQTCELCKQSLKLDFDDFDVNEFYRKNRPTQTQEELVNSGLYLVLLLHLYEQRFAELMRITRRRATRYRLSRNNQHPRAEEDESADSDDGEENCEDKGPSSVFEETTS